MRILAAAVMAAAILSGPVQAQAVSESAWRTLTTSAWIEVCTTPCRVFSVSSAGARFSVATGVPSFDDAPAVVLTPAVPGRDFSVPGLKVWGRALTGPARVVVEPYGDMAGNSGSGASVTRTRTVCALPAYAAGGNVVCTNEAGQQTTTACAANAACLVAAAAPGRRVAEWTNRSAGTTIDVGYSASVAPGNAKGVDGPASGSGQGGQVTESPAHAGAYYAASASAATLVFVEGY